MVVVLCVGLAGVLFSCVTAAAATAGDGGGVGGVASAATGGGGGGGAAAAAAILLLLLLAWFVWGYFVAVYSERVHVDLECAPNVY